MLTGGCYFSYSMSVLVDGLEGRVAVGGTFSPKVGDSMGNRSGTPGSSGLRGGIEVVPQKAMATND